MEALENIEVAFRTHIAYPIAIETNINSATPKAEPPHHPPFLSNILINPIVQISHVQNYKSYR